MANYNLNGLNNIEFEHMIQSLCSKLFNYQNIVFGAGPDGGREATYEGTYDLDGKKVNGYFVIQAKFKECTQDNDRKDWGWAKKEFSKEIAKFKNKKRDLRIPLVYMFFTNIQFTSVSKTGGRDQIDKYTKLYKEFIPNIKIYGFDEICKLLDNNRDVAVTYSSFIMTGDILEQLYNSLNLKNNQDREVIYRYLNMEFQDELYSKLEQANDLTDKKLNLEKVFVDLNISQKNDSDIDNLKFINYSVEIGNKKLSKKQFKMVFIGGPGQGKSTVTQYLAQIYRAYFLKKYLKSKVSSEIESFIKLNVDSQNIPKCFRFPIKIILSDYSEWINYRKKGESITLLAYIQNRIEYKADSKFSEFNNFRTLLKSMSFLFIFDGLDEVPSTSNRDQVISQISYFIKNEIELVHCDALIIATTRPQGYKNEFGENEFEEFSIEDLDNDTCLLYLKKLIKNTITSKDEQNAQYKILEDALNENLTSNIMRTPLQATIMSILVRSGGKPSADKFSLFDDYYSTMLKREKQKNVLKIISKHEDYINDIHYLLGNKLQITSQKETNSSSTIESKDFELLVTEYFQKKEVSESNRIIYTKEIMEAIIDRLVFITENQNNRIGFAIRSTQEYFAAMENVHNQKDITVVNNLKRIANSIYWRNVFIFMVGYIAKNKCYLLDNLNEHISELNGSSLSYNEVSCPKIVHYGTLLSLEILSESILSNWPKEENKLINHMDKLPIITTSTIEHQLEKLKEDVINKGIIDFLIAGVQSNKINIRLKSWKNISVLARNNHNILLNFYDFWGTDEKEEIEILFILFEEGIYSKFIISKFLKYLKWEYFKEINQMITNNKLIDIILEESSYDSSIKYFLCELLFVNISTQRFIKDNFENKIFELLEIKNTENLDFISLITESTVISKIPLFDVELLAIKNLTDNIIVAEVCSKSHNNSKLEIINTFFEYYKNPSFNSLINYFNVLKNKLDYIGYSPYKIVFNANWQFLYMFNLLKSKTFTNNEIENNMNFYGNNLTEIISFQNNLKNKNNFKKNINYYNYEYNIGSKVDTVKSFYEKNYIKNKVHMWDKLALAIVLGTMNLSNDKEVALVVDDKLVDELIEIINLEKYNDSQLSFSLPQLSLKVLLAVIIIIRLKDKKLLDLEINLNLTDTYFPLNIFRDSFLDIASKNILKVISFKYNSINFMKILFSIEKSKSTECNSSLDYSILYDLEYENNEIKTYGYILSLIDTKITSNENKMQNISNFLCEEVKNNNNIFSEIHILIKSRSLYTNLIEKLIQNLYINIEKDCIENFDIASKYEIIMKEFFENNLIN